MKLACGAAHARKPSCMSRSQRRSIGAKAAASGLPVLVRLVCTSAQNTDVCCRIDICCAFKRRGHARHRRWRLLSKKRKQNRPNTATHRRELEWPVVRSFNNEALSRLVVCNAGQHDLFTHAVHKACATRAPPQAHCASFLWSRRTAGRRTGSLRCQGCLC